MHSSLLMVFQNVLPGLLKFLLFILRYVLSEGSISTFQSSNLTYGVAIELDNMNVQIKIKYLITNLKVTFCPVNQDKRLDVQLFRIDARLALSYRLNERNI